MKTVIVRKIARLVRNVLARSGHAVRRGAGERFRRLAGAGEDLVHPGEELLGRLELRRARSAGSSRPRLRGPSIRTALQVERAARRAGGARRPDQFGTWPGAVRSSAGPTYFAQACRLGSAL
ncbi:hypothetical protein [Actinomadura decatromicini]|uniref:Uncharacterized protein n=1 Tax=Actinomadura decatromicini TaxID=2604572 RepID=A0A5D3F3P2_9ACTN|nr:hypothetical protein [Actinomadura decatromicini]TYK42679.1 hypothetical protein FXF68_41620 [Actinomadura decatromicini]